jgi:hypothetical protein
MIFFPVGQREKKSCETESASRLCFRLVRRKKSRRDTSRSVFPVRQPEKTPASPFPAASLHKHTQPSRRKTRTALIQRHH